MNFDKESKSGKKNFGPGGGVEKAASSIGT